MSEPSKLLATCEPIPGFPWKTQLGIAVGGEGLDKVRDAIKDAVKAEQKPGEVLVMLAGFWMRRTKVEGDVYVDAVYAWVPETLEWLSGHTEDARVSPAKLRAKSYESFTRNLVAGLKEPPC